MKPIKPCSGLSGASLVAWLLLMPPFSVTPAGKTVVDTQASLTHWEVFSRHKSATQCRQRRDGLRNQLEKAIEAAGEAAKSQAKTPAKSGTTPDQKAGAFATLRERVAAARCIASDDSRLRAPASSPTGSAHK